MATPWPQSPQIIPALPAAPCANRSESKLTRNLSKALPETCARGFWQTSRKAVFEPCVEWRPKISQWLSPWNIVTWGYSQESKSYLPTESMLPEGGYEVLDPNQARASTPAPYAPGIEAAVRESLLRQLAFINANVR